MIGRSEINFHMHKNAILTRFFFFTEKIIHFIVYSQQYVRKDNSVNDDIAKLTTGEIHFYLEKNTQRPFIKYYSIFCFSVLM